MIPPELPHWILQLAVTATVATSTSATTTTSTDAPMLLDDSLLEEEPPPPPSKQAPVKTGDENVVDEVVITGSRTEKKLAEAPVATEVISRRDLAASGSDNLVEVLEKHPGLDVERTPSGVGVRLEGLEVEHVLILVDGERVTGRFRGGIDPTRFNVENIDHVEIVKGASSALYGSEAIGGVINIITRKTNRPLELELHSQYGSANTFDISGATGAKVGNLTTHVSGGFHRSDGYDLQPADDATTGPTFDTWNIVDRTEYQMSKSVVLKARAEYRLLNQNAVDLRPPTAIVDRLQVIELFSASLGPEFTMSGPAKLKVGLHYSSFAFQILQEVRRSSERPTYDNDRQKIGEVTVQYDRLIADSHLMTIGVDGLLEDQQVGFLDTGSANRQRGSVFLQDEWTVLSSPQQLVAVPGVRIDGDSQFGARVSPKLAVRYDPTPGLVVRGSAGLGFRAPTFEELYLRFDNLGSGYRVIGNQMLRPESSIGVNLGFDWETTEWMQIGLSGYYNDIKDLIATELQPVAPGETNIFQYVNVSSARTDGIEAYLRFRAAPRFDLDLGYSYTDTLDRESGNSLPGRARHRGTVRLGYREKSIGLDASIRASFVGRRPYFDPRTPQDGEPYAAVDARVGKDLFDHFSVFAGVRNLLDAGDPLLLPIPPRTFYFGMSAKWSLPEEKP